MTFRDANADDVMALREMWCRFMTDLHNLAGIVTAHLIDHCLKAGIQPVWSCDAKHPASISVAKKMGYQMAREYEHHYYRLR